MVLLGDEVWGNLDMTGDGHIGSEKLFFDKGFISKIKAARKEKNFTVIDLTKLLGEPICCIVIIEGKGFFDIYTGIDLFK